MPTTAPTQFAGHLCRECGYDLRGIPDPICPECGHAFDPLASPPKPWRRETGLIAACVAVISAGATLWFSSQLVIDYFSMMGGWCGTPQLMVRQQLTVAMPWTLLIPAIAMVPSWRARAGLHVARCATLAAAVGWATCWWVVTYAM